LWEIKPLSIENPEEPKKNTPIPLYAKHYLHLDIPANNEKVGYDFFVGDWVSPYGKGLTNDIYVLFHDTMKQTSGFSWYMEISSASTNDGFVYIEPEKTINSILRFSYFAPANQYDLKKIINNINGTTGKIVYEKPVPVSNNVFFRTRTKTDKLGNVISCNYGKIIDIDSYLARGQGTISFTYYLNPTPNDLNLEFNVKSNLFKNLKRSEEVRQP
jgi:hypothetical protein